MKSAKITVTDEPTLIVAADDTHRTIYLKHSHENNVLYVGNSTVSTTTGFSIAKDEELELVIPSKQTLYGITTEEDTVDVIILTPDVD